MKKIIYVMVFGLILAPVLVVAAPKVMYWSVSRVAQISEDIKVHRMEDGDNTCYIVEGENTAISCVTKAAAFPSTVNTVNYTDPCQITNSCRGER